MRIISGQFKGHQLVSFQASHIRPTTDRVKESLFNKLQGYWEGARVVDLFCGTGNLGLESLSRYADFCLFVDKHKKSLEITQQNIQKLKIAKNKCEIFESDVLSFLRKYKGQPFDIILVDPPFTEKMAHDVMVVMQNSSVFGPSSILSIESAKKEKLDDNYGSLFRFDTKDFGDKVLSLFRFDEVQNEKNSSLSR